MLSSVTYVCNNVETVEAIRHYERRSPRLPKAQREQQLLDVAERLFIEKGYAETSIEDVAQAAGVTRPVVYNHHGSKEGLYLALVKRAREHYRGELQRTLAGIEDPRGQIRAAGDLFFEMIERDPVRWTVLFGGSAVPLFGEHGAQLTDLRFENVEQTAALIRAAAPDADPERIHAFAHAISGVGEQLGRWWLREPGIPRHRLTRHYTDFIWNGLRTIAEP
jgi:AcrR family transcriptional regulator